MTSDALELTQLIRDKQPMVAMVAPSFPIVFSQELLVSKLRRMGFAGVLEVAAGAKITNEQLLAALAADETARFITSPCPSLVRVVRTKYPDLQPYLAFAVDSPMVATARMAQQRYPGYKPVFIGPCIAKKMEAREDYPELSILVVTYAELNDVARELGITDELADKTAFDVAESMTRLYPISGGLAQSAVLRNVLAEDEYEVVSGWKMVEAALKRFPNSRVRVLDILFCEGGCVNGPGIVSELSLENRREKIISYWQHEAVTT